MQERLKALRLKLNLTQSAFASRIGTTQNVVANYEIGRRNPSSSAINNICKEFNVNETWLRTGEGEMYSQAELFSLDRFLQERGASDLELSIVKAYFELDPAIRRAVLDHFRSRLAIDPDEAEAEAVKQEYLLQKRAAAGSSATAGEDGEERRA